jgi:hypothetical protein
MKKIVHLLFLLVGVLVVQHVSAEMTYSPTLPQFGGGNGQALGIVQFEKQQIDARAARAASALAALEREANKTVTTDADRLIASITNFLNVEIARQFSTEILSGDAPSGTISVGDVSIGYLRSDGFLSLEIDDGNGITIIELPVVE